MEDKKALDSVISHGHSMDIQNRVKRSIWVGELRVGFAGDIENIRGLQTYKSLYGVSQSCYPSHV